jgi:hypothetical protein
VGHEFGALFTNFCVQRKLSAHIEGGIPYVSIFRVDSCSACCWQPCRALSVSLAQSLLLDLPRQSQRAEVSQRIGITDITILYHRPLVNDRKVWGDLVPYGKVWRAGANENTTITFSDPVTIEGKALDKGTYGLHMIPNADEWTIIFSKNSTSWGAFTYDEKEKMRCG